MSVTRKDVDHIATLARLEFSEAEKEHFTHQMNEILTYVEKLDELDTSNVEPLSHVIELNNVFREDVVQQSLPQATALQNAPSTKDEHFKVPKVMR